MSPERLRSVSGVPLLLSHQVQRQPTLFLHVLGKRQMILSVDLIQLNRTRSRKKMTRNRNQTISRHFLQGFHINLNFYLHFLIIT